MHLPLVLAFAPAVFFGLLTIVMATLSVRIARQPVPDGAASRRGAESALLLATFVAGILCLLCMVVAFSYVNASEAFSHWGAEGGLD